MKTGKIMIGATKKASSRKIGAAKQVLIYDEIGPQLVRLQLAVNNLIGKAKYDKWISALKSIETSLENLDNKISNYDRKLGVIDI